MQRWKNLKKIQQKIKYYILLYKKVKAQFIKLIRKRQKTLQLMLNKMKWKSRGYFIAKNVKKQAEIKF